MSDPTSLEPTVYEPVKRGGTELGSLTVDSNQLTFKPKNKTESTSAVFHWRTVTKHQANPAKNSKALIKIVTNDGISSPVTFQLKNRAILNQLVEDISRRRSEYNSNRSNPSLMDSDNNEGKNGESSTYSNVRYQSIVGSVTMDANHLVYQSQQDADAESVTIPWNQVIKHQASPAKVSKAMLKLGLSTGKTITLQFTDRKELTVFHDDIKRRLMDHPNHQNKEVAAASISTNGESLKEEAKIYSEIVASSDYDEEIASEVASSTTEEGARDADAELEQNDEESPEIEDTNDTDMETEPNDKNFPEYHDDDDVVMETEAVTQDENCSDGVDAEPNSESQEESNGYNWKEHLSASDESTANSTALPESQQSMNDDTVESDPDTKPQENRKSYNWEGHLSASDDPTVVTTEAVEFPGVGNDAVYPNLKTQETRNSYNWEGHLSSAEDSKAEESQSVVDNTNSGSDSNDGQATELSGDEETLISSDVRNVQEKSGSENENDQIIEDGDEPVQGATDEEQDDESAAETGDELPANEKLPTSKPVFAFKEPPKREDSVESLEVREEKLDNKPEEGNAEKEDTDDNPAIGAESTDAEEGEECDSVNTPQGGSDLEEEDANSDVDDEEKVGDKHDSFALSEASDIVEGDDWDDEGSGRDYIDDTEDSSADVTDESSREDLDIVEETQPDEYDDIECEKPSDGYKTEVPAVTAFDENDFDDDEYEEEEEEEVIEDEDDYEEEEYEDEPQMSSLLGGNDAFGEDDDSVEDFDVLAGKPIREGESNEGYESDGGWSDEDEHNRNRRHHRHHHGHDYGSDGDDMVVDGEDMAFFDDENPDEYGEESAISMLEGSSLPRALLEREEGRDKTDNESASVSTQSSEETMSLSGMTGISSVASSAISNSSSEEGESKSDGDLSQSDSSDTASFEDGSEISEGGSESGSSSGSSDGSESESQSESESESEESEEEEVFTDPVSAWLTYSETGDDNVFPEAAPKGLRKKIRKTRRKRKESYEPDEEEFYSDEEEEYYLEGEKENLGSEEEDSERMQQSMNLEDMSVNDLESALVTKLKTELGDDDSGNAEEAVNRMLASIKGDLLGDGTPKSKGKSPHKGMPEDFYDWAKRAATKVISKEAGDRATGDGEEVEKSKSSDDTNQENRFNWKKYAKEHPEKGPREERDEISPPEQENTADKLEVPPGEVESAPEEVEAKGAQASERPTTTPEEDRDDAANAVDPIAPGRDSSAEVGSSEIKAADEESGQVVEAELKPYDDDLVERWTLRPRSDDPEVRVFNWKGFIKSRKVSSAAPKRPTFNWKKHAKAQKKLAKKKTKVGLDLGAEEGATFEAEKLGMQAGAAPPPSSSGDIDNGVDLLKKLITDSDDTTRGAILKQYLAPPPSPEVTRGHVSPEELLKAIAKFVETIRAIKRSDNIPEVTEARQVAIVARLAIIHHYGDGSETLKTFERGLAPAFAPKRAAASAPVDDATPEAPSAEES